MRHSTSKGLFGNWLRTRMEYEGIEIQELANELGVSRTTIYNHMNRRKEPRMYLIREYSRYFGVDMWFLYDLVLHDYKK